MPSPEYPDSPRMAVAVLIRKDEKLLAILRGKAPAEDTWALPGGSVELGETLREAAERETWEETGLRVRAGRVLTAVDAIYHDARGRLRFHYVIVYVEAEYLGGKPDARDDVREARWLSLEELKARAAEPATLSVLVDLLQT